MHDDRPKLHLVRSGVSGPFVANDDAFELERGTWTKTHGVWHSLDVERARRQLRLVPKPLANCRPENDQERR